MFSRGLPLLSFRALWKIQPHRPVEGWLYPHRSRHRICRSHCYEGRKDVDLQKGLEAVYMSGI